MWTRFNPRTFGQHSILFDLSTLEFAMIPVVLVCELWYDRVAEALPSERWCIIYHHVDHAERKTRLKGKAVMGVPDRNN